MNGADVDICRVCTGAARFAFRKAVLGRPVKYFSCERCGYLQTEFPYWLAEAYNNAINDGDTGILSRNQQNVGRVIMTLLVLGKLRGMVIDHAGGYGILVRLLRDAGIDARWRDKYCSNLLARGFEADQPHADLLTAFEVFEHLENPLEELSTMLENTPAILLSTDLIPDDETALHDWWYLGTDHGQHIGFFTVRTLQWMARHLGCYVATDGRSIHLFSRTPIPRSWPVLMRWSRWWRGLARRRLHSRTLADAQVILGAKTNLPIAITDGADH